MDLVRTKRSKRRTLKRTRAVNKPAQMTEEQLAKHAIANPVLSMRALVKSSLYNFVRCFWKEYNQEDFITNWHIIYICSELEKIAKRVANNETNTYDLVINVPPGTTKTAIVSIMFPLWCWVNWFHMRFITSSYTAPLSLESAEYSRDIVRSDLFKRLFPELGIKEDKDTKSNFRVIKKVRMQPATAPRIIAGGNRFSTSVTGSVTGFHGHINIVDDPTDPNRVLSEAEVKKANYWYDNTLSFRKVNKRVTTTIVIMQRLHQDDLTGHILKSKKYKKGKIRHICLPGEIKNYRKQVKPPELVKYYKNDLLDAIRLDWNALTEINDLGQFTYGGQVGQDPVPLGGGMFQTDYLTTADAPPHYLRIEKMVRYWDKAGTEGDGAFTAGVKIAKLTDGKYLIMDVKRGQWATNKREAIIKATAQADGPDVQQVVEQEPGSGGKESAEATVTNLSGFSVYKDRPVGDKALRADPFSVQVNNGNVQMLRAAWNDEFVEEMKYFPGSKYKDQIDAGSGAFNRLTGKKKARVGRQAA